MFLTSTKSKHLIVLKEMIEAGKVKPIIDKTFLLNETSQAFRYIEEVHARGKIVISIKEGKQNV